MKKTELTNDMYTDKKKRLKRIVVNLQQIIPT